MSGPSGQAISSERKRFCVGAWHSDKFAPSFISACFQAVRPFVTPEVVAVRSQAPGLSK
jgi:hypothetical protein